MADFKAQPENEQNNVNNQQPFKYPNWQAEFQEVVIELNREKLFDKIQRFETVVFVPLQELTSSADHHEERQAIDDALTAVRVLKRDRLAHPDWK